MLFGKALKTFDPQKKEMLCMKRFCARSEPAGLSKSTLPGFFHNCMALP